ncbi:MAG: hypothetical protein R3248_02375 [Candidatus Promineifilaceae bacterium]|nr:hypothetical protein [Candidatus Promineifilaceae bacterium]
MRPNKRWLWHLLMLLAVLVACDQEQPTIDAGRQTSTAPATAAPTAESTPTAEPTPTATATATPRPQPSVSAIQQGLEEAGTVTISELFAPGPSWLVIHADDGGQRGDVLGYTAVPEGESTDVTVTVDVYRATPTLHAALHQDAGERGEFEFPGPDEALRVDGETVATTFPVDIRVLIPSIVVSNQEVERGEGQILIDSVTVDRSGWVVLHADSDGEPGPILGQTPVSEGVNEGVAVHFDWQQVTPRLHAALYEDTGEGGRFDAAIDEPIAVNGTPIRSSFTASLPTDVLVINQPASGGEVVVERAVNNETGWLVVYNDFEGMTADLLGYVPLPAGVSRGITVPLNGNNITPMLHIMVHEDAEPEGEFNYPGQDGAVLNEGRLMLFSFETDTGSYVVTEDQPLGDEGTVQIPLVVTDVDTWVVIHASGSDGEGGPGAIIGRKAVPAGIHRDVRVEVEAEEVTPTLYVALHLDLGERGAFEYPNGPDTPLLFEQSPIQAPFALAQGE